MIERLQKILSARGVCSRRKAEEYLDRGLVKVNGKIAKVGDKADPEVDKIEVDGTVLQERAEMLYYLMNKPEGVETVNIDRTGPKEQKQKSQKVPQAQTVRDVLPPDLRGRVFPVGRLDKDSSGLLLFTNDGVLAYRLTHPKFDHQKEYEVATDRNILPATCKSIEEGFIMDGFQTKPLQCKKVAPNRARVVLTEGKNRQIRRMFQQVGYTVKELKRVRIMNLEDPKLMKGKTRVLTQAEAKGLLTSVGL